MADAAKVTMRDIVASIDTGTWFRISQIFYVTALVCTVIATVFVNHFAGELNAEANKKIAEASVEVAKANARAEEARAAVAKAVEGQQRLQTDAEKSRAAQERLRQENLKLSIKFEEERQARLRLEEQMAPRRLSVAKAQTIARVILVLPRQSVDVTAPLGLPEPIAYAQAIKQALERGNWQVNGINQGVFTPNVPRGVTVRVKDANSVPPAADVLMKALIDAGISAVGQVNAALQPGQVELLIGVKE